MYISKLWWTFKIHENYNFEIIFFNKIRNYSDGISFFKFNVEWDRYLADHSPKFGLIIIVFNFVLIEMNIYYRYHRDKKN